MMQNVNITSVNVRGLNTYEKRNKFFTWVNQSKIDVLLLQETHFLEKFKEKYDTNWNGKSIHAFSDSAYSRGVSILFRKELDVQILNTHKSEDARKVLVNVTLNDEILSFVSIYAPNSDNARIPFLIDSKPSSHAIYHKKVKFFYVEILTVAWKRKMINLRNVC